MQVVVHAGDVLTAPFELLVVGLFQGDVSRNPTVKALDKALGGALHSVIEDEDFSGKGKQKLVLHSLGKLRAKRVALLGLGKKGENTTTALVNLGGTATRLAKDVGAKDALLVLPEIDGELNAELALVARGVALGGYSYKRYKSEKGGKKKPPQKLALALPSSDATGAKGAKDVLGRAEVVSRAIALARDLVNESPIDLYPESFAARASEVAKKSGLKIKVIEPAQLKKMNANLLLGVGAGSSRGPRLVHITYTPPGKPKDASPLVLVGKGITFDSGGLSLKPSASMEDMKMDMAGAAAVLATMQALATLKPKRVVHGIMALAENMPSGTAIRPGDVITGSAGKSVEINNTDAEGRLVLADALHYALDLKPRGIIDLATLTGACVVALGPHTTGVFSNDDALAEQVLTSAKRAGEHFWRMPMTPMLKDQLKSDVADMKNTGSREGGAITAALFLSEFVGDTPWVHLDIAGPAHQKHEGGAESKGGSGVGVATLVDLLG